MNIQLSIPKINYYNNSFKSSESNKKSSLEKTPSKDSFELSVGYVNDLHGQTNNMIRILSGIKGDVVFSAGDNDIGDEKNRKVHDATAKFLNLAGVKGTALGNHEMDTMQGDLKETVSKLDGDILAVNLKQIPLDNQSDSEIKNFNKTNINEVVKKSKIIEVKGEKIGLIGATPVDLSDRWTHPDYHKDISANNFDETLDLINNEVKNLKEQGVNKIFLLSHLGIKLDKQVAENLEDIDVIIGGHTHELIQGIEEGSNLFYSKSGEPVIITEAGRDGKQFGLLNLTFDENGVIVKAQNNIAKTANFHRNLINQYLFNQILGKPEVLGVIESAPSPPKSLVEENPHANFMCDAMKEEMNADIAIWNNGGPRNYFKKGTIDSSDVKEIAPFADNISVADVSEKTIVNAFKRAIDMSYSSPGHKPGLLAVSGLNYTVSPSKKALIDMNYIDRDGNVHPIDVNNPREDKKYRVVTDSFMMSWGADYDILAPKEQCKEYLFAKDFLACQYIKHLNAPVNINQTGRVKFVD